MKKLIFIPIFLLLLISIVVAKDLTISPTIIDKTYEIGNVSLSSTSIDFTNSDVNDSFTLTFSTEGNVASFLSLSPSSLSFSGSESKTLIVNYNIPDTTNPGLYSGKIWYGTGSEYIPVYIGVLQQQTSEECRIVLSPSSYSYTIKKGTPTYTQAYSFRIPTICSQGAEITDISVSGSVLSDAGWEPLRLTGAIPTGEISGGTSVPFDIEFSSQDLASGTYSPKVSISGIDLKTDKVISNILDFKIQVVGTATPIPDVITPPIFDPIPQDIALNETYNIVARNVDPNIEIIIEPNEFIYGEKVELSSDTWTYKFRGVKVGNTILRVYASLLGGVIGTPVEQEIRVIQGTLPTGSTNLTVDFFPSLENIQPSQEVRVLVKDKKNNNAITTYTLWLDGTQIEGNAFNPIQGSQLRVSSPGYNDYIHTFTISKKTLVLGITPSSPIFGDNVTISVIGDGVNIINESIVTLNGASIGNSFTVDSYGVKAIRATHANYEPASMNLTIPEPISAITTIPLETDLALNEEINIELNRDTPWTVWFYEEGDETNKEVINSGTSNLVYFTPEDSGFYYVETEDGQLPLAYWEIKGGIFKWIFSLWWLWGLIILVVGGGYLYSTGKLEKYISLGDGETEDESAKYEWDEKQKKK